ncbi:LuxR C-terminal-related transcriptional regulator [Mycolicibacter heraklionensis]|uniref:LuxR C-terminal-related transcriptional regulator n=1 Tax=Mycolicibacter heraklionensis TaxID=512402 RepID=A0A9X7ZE46_9MYCO|nr:LuxR C-terminal-related transcriptional regulator [Mycolicibacter heraklionensis]QZA07371.1 LuxR C-terminal-related transcriptional regulator [Mycolicibacter heraklionensis]
MMSNASAALSPHSPPRTVVVVCPGDSRPQWQPPTESLTTGLSWLESTLTDVVAAHRGARLVEQDHECKFAATFADAGDAVACAIALQRAPAAPIRPRIAMHADKLPLVQPYAHPRTLANRAARLCDLGHGGQTLLSETAQRLLADRLPPDAWLVDLGAFRLRGIPYPERVAQLCHRDLATDFPPLRTGNALHEPYFPTPLTSFVGRDAELTELRRLIDGNRLVTLTGSGGVGKTRLALQLADEFVDRFRDGAWCVDLAPITDPDLLLERVTHVLGLPDRPDRYYPLDTLVRFIADRQLLLVLDNCEHLLDACAQLAATLLAASAELTIVATSREPIGVAGEVTWKTPSLSLVDEAVELFRQRARLVRPGFTDTDGDADLVAEICRRLDGVPLAIELAATRVRALSLTEIADGLGERFQLLTGGARTAVPRQQTLRASEDWSHDLLSEPERVVFRRLAPFPGGFDLDAAHAVAGGTDLSRTQIVDKLTQLVGKSLVVADSTGESTRFRLLQTVQQYALEKLEQSGESEAIQARHRDHYTAMFDAGITAGYGWHIEQAELEIDNLRAAFMWSREHGDIELAARLASSLLPLWIHSRTLEGLAWFNAVLTDGATMAPAARARALADKTIFDALTGNYGRVEQAEEAVSIARHLDEPGLLAWALAACGFTCSYGPELALPYFEQAIALSPALNDDWRLSQIYGVQAYSAFVAGDLDTMRLAAEKGAVLADAVGDWSVSRLCRLCLGLAHLHRAELTMAVEQARQVAMEAEAAYDPLFSTQSLTILAEALACQGDTRGAHAAAEACVEAAAELIDFHRAIGFGAVADALLAAGDISGALRAADAACEACALPQLLAINGNPVARVALESGDLAAARRWAGEALSVGSGIHRILLLEIRGRVAMAEGQVEQAERDACEALAIAADAEAYLAVPDLLELLAAVATATGRHHYAARLFGSAAGARSRTGAVRAKVYDANYAATVSVAREAMQENDFERSWAQGAASSTAEAIAYACQGDGKGRAESKRPSSGWASLTPAERNVVRLISAGLRDKDIAAQLSVSPRTVHSHLNRIYTKLNISSRLQLAQVAAQHA